MPLAPKTEEERPLLVDMMKEVKEDASRRQQQMLKEEKENRVVRKEEEKENRVGRKEEASHSWRRSVAVAPRK